MDGSFRASVTACQLKSTIRWLMPGIQRNKGLEQEQRQRQATIEAGGWVVGCLEFSGFAGAEALKGPGQLATGLVPQAAAGWHLLGCCFRPVATTSFGVI